MHSDRQFNGIKATRNYIYRSKRGPKPTAVPMSQYLLPQPIVQQDITEEAVMANIQVEEEVDEDEENIAPTALIPAKKRGRGRPKMTDEEKLARKEARNQDKATKNKGGRKALAAPALSTD